MKLSAVIDQLVDEKGLDRSILSSIICEGMIAAYQKKYPGLEFQARYDKKTDEVLIISKKTVVSSVLDQNTEISLRKSHYIDKKIKENDEIWLPFEGGIGRIEVLRAKQVIASKIRDIEASVIYNEFKEKEGSVIHGVVHKCERSGVVVKLQDVFAFLPKSLTIPGERCAIGFTIRALLKEVLPQPRNENQLILDRVSADFLKSLFELEVPEVFERLVEIKKVVRKPGYKSKVLVISNDSNIDPVGTCVGVGGVRIKPILKELGGERIDVLAWKESEEQMVKDALKPAEIKRVVLVDSENANVWLNEDQRSLAIGKMGQNISLASQLLGININLMRDDQRNDEQEEIFDDLLDDVISEEKLANEEKKVESENTQKKE
ncbi:transcription termination factor NusA [bacterium]|nr:transcription termination factor NusA [bacterium]